MKINKVVPNLSKLNKKVLSLVAKYSPHIIGLLIVAILAVTTAVVLEMQAKRPSSVSGFAKTAVMIVNSTQTSGGSGVILKSSSGQSIILTNKHICRIIEGGGYVITENATMLVQQFKKYPTHDLCLIKVNRDLGINTEVAPTAPDYYSKANISGHPALLPHVLTFGDFSGDRIINLIVGFNECKAQDYKGRYALYCIFFGGVPVLQEFEAQLVTGTILPGSSGSGVFNSKGQISGVVFAGQGDGLGYAFIVPHSYVVDFLNTQNSIEWTSVARPSYKDILERIFSTEKKCRLIQHTNHPLNNFCKNKASYIPWVK